MSGKVKDLVKEAKKDPLLGKGGKAKLVVSSEKEGQWLERASNCFNDMHDRLRGQLLTTLEVALPTGSRLEALKARVRATQGEIWDILDSRKYQQFTNWFSVLGPDESTDTKPSEEEYNVEVARFQKDLEQLVIEELDWFKKIVINLVVLATEDQEKKEAQKWEVDRLIDNASYKLRRWLKIGIENVFSVEIR